MTRLSVNVNKIASLRNARGGDLPNVVEVASACEKFGAQGITIHPRPDERHITTKDVYALQQVVKTEFNIEGYPNERYLKLVKDNLPTQATLVPDGPGVLTSNAGWDTIKNKEKLTAICKEIADLGVRVSLFIDPLPQMVEGAKEIGVDSIELYTENYAKWYNSGDKAKGVKEYTEAAKLAHGLGLRVNGGHDLNQENLAYFKQEVPYLEEVSIGHALISEALYLGLEKTIENYLNILR